jgi:hypothetical protein
MRIDIGNECIEGLVDNVTQLLCLAGHSEAAALKSRRLASDRGRYLPAFRPLVVRDD